MYYFDKIPLIGEVRSGRKTIDGLLGDNTNESRPKCDKQLFVYITIRIIRSTYMKFYETNYEDYLHSAQMFNFHPELASIFQKIPKNIKHFENLIVYGAPGIGKYTQVLCMLRAYSPSELKYDKKMKITTEKNEYIYQLSDCHYEIDMGLLGCNSKNTWHEIYLQIVDIVSMNKMNRGILVCKNFHLIHNELLDIFYSYMQHNEKIKFVLLTEHLSFIPNNILSSCQTVNIGRPSEDMYKRLYKTKVQGGIGGMGNTSSTANMEDFLKKIHGGCQGQGHTGLFIAGGAGLGPDSLVEIEHTAIMNLKELASFSHIKKPSEIPEDIFNIICNHIIRWIDDYRNIRIAELRDTLYDILIYNLEIGDCIWHIFSHFVELGRFPDADISDILNRIYVFLKYYNNNYRPIYHLESIIFYFIIKIHGVGMGMDKI